ncbi:MAG: hypothetical protein ACBR12_16220 [Microcoleus sp.]|uniref:Uncharacterized protein n=1 Tax=Microcoleus anatoxicus PTRS2 TaxID=2705321 RepID=A0ABU8YJ68_9CYAN
MEQPHSIDSKHLITYNLDEMPQGTFTASIKIIAYPVNLGFIASKN